MIKLIIFDWDDVITLGAKDGYFACYHKALDGVGIHLDPEVEKARILAQWSKPFREELNELLKEHPEFVDEACKLFENEYWGNTFVDALQMLPGTNESLLRLKEKYVLAVATGNQPDMLQKRIIPHFHIPDVFSQIESSFFLHITKMKPHPYMLQTIMKKQRVSPQETIYIGDAKTDVEMARHAGVLPVVVLSGHLNKNEAQNLNVTHIIDNVTSLENILAKRS